MTSMTLLIVATMVMAPINNSCGESTASFYYLLPLLGVLLVMSLAIITRESCNRNPTQPRTYNSETGPESPEP